MRRTRRRSKRRYALAAALLASIVGAQTASSAAWAGGVRVPRHYRVAKAERMAAGVWHIQLIKRADPDQFVNVARLDRSSPHRLAVLLSGGVIAGPEPRTQRTSTMCRRARCLLAVNGDFFSDGMPIGGLVLDGEPARSPAAGRRQFSLTADERPSIALMTMAATLETAHRRVPSGLRLLGGGPTLQRQETPIDGVNVPRARDGIVLFTPRWGPTTGSRTGFEIVARVLSSSRTIRAGVDVPVELLAARSDGGRIPSDGVVVSGLGRGADALAALWNQVASGAAERRATLRVSVSPEAVTSVAGKELLVRDGEEVAPRGSGRAPRTMIGWNAAGDVLLVTVDGRQPGRAEGMTLREAAYLMRRLGAVAALNLDGGGSTTFVRKGRVVNRPSDRGRRERPVAVAVAILPAA